MVHPQSCAEIKLPPGIRRIWQFISFINATISGRNPLMLSAGISDTAPTLKVPLPSPMISKRAFVVSTLGLSLKWRVFHVRGADTRWETDCPSPQLNRTVTFTPRSALTTKRPLYGTPDSNAKIGRAHV